MKRTKIVCTIGPASEAPATLVAMIKSGMNVCRLNMSHGDYKWHGRAIRTIRAAAKRAGEPTAILLDLQGPKARLGEIRNWKLEIGQRVLFTTGRKGLSLDRKDSPLSVPIAVPNFHKYVKRGSHLLIADGMIECVVERVAGHDIHAKVTLAGELKSRKGIAIQGVSLPLPSLTAKDKRDIQWARSQDIDFVALSFVKRAADVVALRRLLPTSRHFDRAARRVEKSHTLRGVRSLGYARDDKIGPAIIVKIETREAVQNFDEILKVTDAVMVARGDLGLAFAPEDVPVIQKEIIEKCRRRAKPVIVATEMLASMERSPRPTRAEASDVANAVIDHTDAVMLSGESATGQFPVEAVVTMARIIEKMEKSRFDDVSIGMEMKHGTTEEETALVASVLARASGAKAIVAGSLTGHTGRLLSRFRTEVPLIVGSPNLRVVRQLNLSWGVQPFLMQKMRHADALLAALFIAAHRQGIKKSSKVVFIANKKLAPHAQGFVGVRAL